MQYSSSSVQTTRDDSFSPAWLGLASEYYPRECFNCQFLEAGLQTLREASPTGIWNPHLVLQTTVLEFAILLCDAATLYVLLYAVGADCPPWIIFASFVAASVMAIIGLVPGGLGTFEGTCVAMLHVHGVSLEAALACTLLLRGFTFWLPMLPGLWLARRELSTPPR